MTLNNTVIRMILPILLILGGYAVASSEAPPSHLYIIPVKGDVEPGLAAFIKRALETIDDLPQNQIILDMDTFGGRVDSALVIVDQLLKMTNAKTIAFVSQKAISAGALIALSCRQITMQEHTSIGDCAPILLSNDGPKMMGEKFQSPLRAKFRTLARRNHYPTALAEAMVTLDMEVVRVTLPDKVIYLDKVDFEEMAPQDKERVLSKKTVVKKGELLTMNDAEAQALGFSQMSVASLEALLAQPPFSGMTVVRIKENWSERFVRLITKISPFIMIIGFIAVYLEIKTPGFGLPGIIGVLCLGLVFLNQYIVGLANHTELLLLILGVLILGVEIFVLPGTGLAGITGVLLIFFSMLLSFQDFVLPDPSQPWEEHLLMHNVVLVLGSAITAFFFSMIIVRYGIPKLGRYIKGPYLTATLSESHADSHETQTIRPGDQGVALTFLRPAGKVRIGDTIIDVITEGVFIEKDTPVVINQIKGNRVIVTPVEGGI